MIASKFKSLEAGENMKAVVVSNGDIKDINFAKDILKDSHIIIAADGGSRHILNSGFMPDALIGDLDSVDEETLDKIKTSSCAIVKYPREKDYTDTQIAIDYAIEKKADEIILLGCVGDRLDHTLANIFLLVKLIKQGIKACIVNEKNAIYITDHCIELNGNIGDLLSLIPVGGDVTGIYTKGLKYGLAGKTIKMGDPLGISNVFIDNKIEVKIESGYLLVILSRD